MTTFEAALQAHAQNHKGVAEEQRDLVAHVLSMPTRGLLGIRRKNLLTRMERRARTELGLGPAEAIDWGAIDWAAIFQMLVKFLMMIFGL